MTDIKTQELVRFKTPHTEGKSMLRECDIPQAQEMIPLTECADDKGVALPSHMKAKVSEGKVIPYLRFPSGVEDFVPSQNQRGELINVPKGTTFIRSRDRADSLDGVSMIAGGCI